MQAEKMIQKDIIDQQSIALTAVKNHNNGKENPNAQYRFGATEEGVLNDRICGGTIHKINVFSCVRWR